ncbi:MAG: MBOAT family protein [Desulforhopalus sp.]|nr:MBOAT family protein [Desulforhopalus sp.]
MVFSSTVFLFLFLPAVLVSVLFCGKALRNLILLAASLLFYAWGESAYVLLMLASIASNHVFGLLIDSSKKRGGCSGRILALGIIANLGLLGYFKYTGFLVGNLSDLLQVAGLPAVSNPEVHLPIGISFFTFQALSYIVDVYKGTETVQKNPIKTALYISLFPQLIAGPIVRYHDIAKELSEWRVTFDDFFSGVQRFIIGLGKKVLVANVLGSTADYLFSLPPDRIPAGLAWVGAIAYTLQIYYDFSGYSDMAIGLGRMFGFHFPENFNYPYFSRSMKEFWRRWHISLSSWFKDYLYLPLGGNRKGAGRTYFNLVVVFFLCGLWHGASWTFVTWGLYHGFFLVWERLYPGRKMLEWMPSPVQHLYTLVAVIIGWVIFRADSIGYAMGYVKAMFSFGRPDLFNSQIFINVNNNFILTFIIAIIFSAPVREIILKALNIDSLEDVITGKFSGAVWQLLSFLSLGFIYLYSISSILGSDYNPFLYFRF